MRLDVQGLTLWKSHWKAKKLVTEMARMSWLNGSMATQPDCGREEGKEGKKMSRAIKDMLKTAEVWAFVSAKPTKKKLEDKQCPSLDEEESHQ
ncbi:hypothetical protein EYF80_005081 [Liparis tanakae]|uniref:Uncharacterized protein n=1 Tax=Liparis tanakae TaxID=230148 RepID=A0A4Z2J396_9TELE|nr:hypothetical protein EYF80_005081 [Liparis tanakae]